MIQIELPTEIGGRPLLRDGALGTWQGNSRQRPKRSVGRPDAFQRIAVDFPDLRLVGIHTGYPWERELVAAAWKHENLTIGADSHHPSRWSRDLVDFIASYGREQAVFGTNYPALGFGEFIGAIDELGFTDDVKRALLTENARRIYKLDV